MENSILIRNATVFKNGHFDAFDQFIGITVRGSSLSYAVDAVGDTFPVLGVVSSISLSTVEEGVWRTYILRDFPDGQVSSFAALLEDWYKPETFFPFMAYSSGEQLDINREPDLDMTFSGVNLLGLDPDDWVTAGGGSDNLDGAGGDDDISGGGGADTLNGGAGKDRLFGQMDDDLLMGGADDDHLNGGTGADVLMGEGGADRLAGGADDDRIYGGQGNDLIHGGTGSDFIDGGAGDDRIYAQGGSDTLIDLEGNNMLNGGAGDDILIVGDGNDRLIGGGGQDQLHGFGGTDRLNGGVGADSFIFTAETIEGENTMIVEDFTLGEDRISFQLSRDTTAQDVMDFFVQFSVQKGKAVYFEIPESYLNADTSFSITLRNTQLTDLDASSFLGAEGYLDVIF